MASRKKKREPKKPEPPQCECIAYESAEEEDDMGMGACHCGHSPEEHTFAGCEGEPTRAERPHAR